MSVDLLSLISTFHPLDDRESSVASFRTLVPWVGPEAYLNTVYRPAPGRWLFRVAEKLRFPPAVIDFLQRQNRAMLFSGSLSLYGVVEPDQLLNRQDRFSLPPVNIEPENGSRQRGGLRYFCVYFRASHCWLSARILRESHRTAGRLGTRTNRSTL